MTEPSIYSLYPPDMGKFVEDPNECNWRVRDDYVDGETRRRLFCTKHGLVCSVSVTYLYLAQLDGIHTCTNVIADAWQSHVEAHKPEPIGQLPVHLL